VKNINREGRKGIKRGGKGREEEREEGAYCCTALILPYVHTVHK
jgi:hypothetical protein